jgi:cytochrome oxidase Cu insertion factor (SCO1/SenC/PrrC family)
MVVNLTCQTAWIARILMVALFVGAPGASSLETFHTLPTGNQSSAPAFTLPDHHGTPMHSADLRGKVVVVRFWATW